MADKVHCFGDDGKRHQLDPAVEQHGLLHWRTASSANRRMGRGRDDRTRCAFFLHRHSGAVRSTEPGISRFRVRSVGPPRNDSGENGEIYVPAFLPGGLLSRIRRSRCMRMWAASAEVLARAMARSKATRASSLRSSCIRKAPRTPKKWK